MNIVGLKILDWHKHIDRDLPWKQTDDPYFIWLSEIILQQTRVTQGLPYYVKFTEQYPTVHHLAKATEDQVFKTWEGLGYYSRARNLHSTAKYISEKLQGEFPNNYQDLLKLKGIGPYTAAAISSFAFGEDRAVLDGNVFRVLSRIYDMDIDILSSKGKKIFGELAHSTMIAGKSAEYNQAIMDFGALQCLPSKPLCMFCPLQDHCAAFGNGTISERPVKKKAKGKRIRHLHFLVTKGKENKNQGSTILIQKRSKNDIWKGLHQFPLIECKNLQAPSKQEWEKHIHFNIDKLTICSQIYKQTLSHQHIHAYFHYAEISKIKQTPRVEESNYNYLDDVGISSYISTTKEGINQYSFPKIIRDFIKHEFSI